ncbi:MAG: 4Fe-4S binding protein [Firmicutes bacterium]|nr:4Fe-4S binding protein [Bacillota bacterium]
MKIRKVRAVYFSPAGSTGAVTEYIAGKMASALEAETESIDFTLPASRKAKYSFGPDELAVFGMPTYAGRIPNLILPHVREMFSGNNTPSVSLVTFGNRSFDSSLTELVQETGSKGFRVFAAGAWVCRHVFSHRLAPGRPDQVDCRKMDVFASEAVTMLNRILAKGPDEAAALPVIRGGEPVGPYYVPRGEDGRPAVFLKAKPETDPAKCVRCGTCAEVCPMGSVSRSDFSDVPGICIKCQACIRHCPEHARYFKDEAFLSHVRMLENHCTGRREPEWYWGK